MVLFLQPAHAFVVALLRKNKLHQGHAVSLGKQKSNHAARTDSYVAAKKAAQGTEHRGSGYTTYSSRHDGNEDFYALEKGEHDGPKNSVCFDVFAQRVYVFKVSFHVLVHEKNGRPHGKKQKAYGSSNL